MHWHQRWTVSDQVASRFARRVVATQAAGCYCACKCYRANCV